jgi:drug/metabolite transporter (DMT)-like permease
LLVALALLCTAVAFLVQTVAQKHISSEDAAIINAMGPLFAVIFAVILLHESMNFREVFGCILLLMGVIVTQLNVFGAPLANE